MSRRVHQLWFVQEYREGEDTELLIGIYETEADAKGAIDRLRNKPGFVEFPDGFQIHPCELGQDGWTEGFLKVDGSSPKQGRISKP